MRTAQYYFNGDSLNRAIKGDGVHSGFLDIADQYGSTPAGQLANYYLGLCYYQKKDYQTNEFTITLKNLMPAIY